MDVNGCPILRIVGGSNLFIAALDFYLGSVK